MRKEQIGRHTIYLDTSRSLMHLLYGTKVDCIVTSPPYYNMRDYGNDVWQGGDHTCNHATHTRTARQGDTNNKDFARKSKEDIVLGGLYKSPCPKCGAVRQSTQLGQESTPEEYINNIKRIMHDAMIMMKPTGTCWLNLGDTYKDRNLLQIPNRVALALQEWNYILRNEIIWYKRNAMPQSCRDRFTVDFEKIFFFTKQDKYYFEKQLEPYSKPMNRWGGQTLKADGVSNWDELTGQQSYRDRDMRLNPAGKNKRCVWDVPTKSNGVKHSAVYPPELITPCILAGCPEGGVVLDPFCGSGTTGIVCERTNRTFIGIEVNPTYFDVACKRLEQEVLCGNKAKSS